MYREQYGGCSVFSQLSYLYDYYYCRHHHDTVSGAAATISSPFFTATAKPPGTHRVSRTSKPQLVQRKYALCEPYCTVLHALATPFSASPCIL
jgi:hypothetical protein